MSITVTLPVPVRIKVWEDDLLLDIRSPHLTSAEIRQQVETVSGIAYVSTDDWDGHQCLAFYYHPGVPVGQLMQTIESKLFTAIRSKLRPKARLQRVIESLRGGSPVASRSDTLAELEKIADLLP